MSKENAKLSQILKNRHEILFLYDVTFANPNGDPDENRPRIDEYTGRNLVTDVRLKRTIRDYLHNFKELEIFVRDRYDKSGNLFDAKTAAKQFNNSKEEILKCIDIRLFGGTIPITIDGQKDSSITLTGPVQFNIGQSLHKVQEQYIKGTGGFASGTEKQQKTFREEYVLPYSLVCFYGVINENAAKDSLMTEEDKEILLDAIWNGTKNLITRSKLSHVPRLLLIIEYTKNNFHIGGLQNLLEFEKLKIGEKIPEDEELRSPKDYKLKLTRLVERLQDYKENIARIRVLINEDLQTDIQFEDTGLTSEKLNL